MKLSDFLKGSYETALEPANWFHDSIQGHQHGGRIGLIIAMRQIAADGSHVRMRMFATTWHASESTG